MCRHGDLRPTLRARARVRARQEVPRHLATRPYLAGYCYKLLSAVKPMARSYDDDRVIPLVEKWDDMFTRANFSTDIDGSKVLLKKVLAPYRHLSPMQPCGLKNCRTPNANGYLIVAVDGRETNIGADCGRKHFPDFHAQTVHIDRIVRERELRARAVEAKTDVDRVQAEIEDIRKRDRGADWLSRCLRGLKKVLCDIDPQLWVTIKRRGATGQAEVNEVRALSKAEAKARTNVIRGIDKTKKSVAFEEIRVGQFTGLEVLSPGLDLHKILVDNLGAAISRLRGCDPENDPIRVLRLLVQAHGDVGGQLRQAERAIDAGHEFFSESNMKLLPYLSQDARHKSKLQGITVERLLRF
jgi:hypothetical protein